MDDMTWGINTLANISLAFSLDAQTRAPPAESCVGSAIDAFETIRRVDRTVAVPVISVVDVVSYVFARSKGRLEDDGGEPEGSRLT
jgi:hypothetical protein